MIEIKKEYGHIALELVKNSKQTGNIDPNAVYQEANKSSRKILGKVLGDLMLPGSEIVQYEELKKLHDLASKGKSCLILMEHYSNFDLPNLYYLLENQHEGGEAIGEAIIAMAGMKLNTESDFVRAFTEAYTRIVIYPSRSLAPLMGSEKYKEESALSTKINMAALHEMVRQKHAGKIILLFPSGTRYRPGVEDTKRGLPEIDSYLKGFDYFLPIGIAGNTLRINTKGSMSEDFAARDCMIFHAGKVTEAKEWRKSVRASMPEGSDAKQYSADRVMDILQELHDAGETIRSERLPEDYQD